MWLFLFFDLPTHTASHRQAYRTFKKELKKLRFHRLQYSVYIRCVTHAATSNRILEKIASISPKNGKIQVITVPDAAYQRMMHLEDGQQRNHAWSASMLFW